MEFQLRPIGEADAVALGALITSLSDRDREWRFHHAVRGLTATALHRLTCIDHHDHVGFVVTTRRAGTEALVAEARWAVDHTGTAAEFALTVAAPWRRRGIGLHCLRALDRAASRRGLRWLYGQVLRDNAPMVALVRRCHFLCSPHGGDERVLSAEIRVGRLSADAACA